jgi:hypothetical protein
MSTNVLIGICEMLFNREFVATTTAVLPIGAVVGGLIGGIVLVVIIIVAIAFACRRVNQKRETSVERSQPEATSTSTPLNVYGTVPTMDSGVVPRPTYASTGNLAETYGYSSVDDVPQGADVYTEFAGHAELQHMNQQMESARLQ